MFASCDGGPVIRDVALVLCVCPFQFSVPASPILPLLFGGDRPSDTGNSVYFFRGVGVFL